MIFVYFPLCSILFVLQVVYMLLNIATIWAYCVIRMFLFNCFILRLASSILLFFRETYIKFNELNLHLQFIVFVQTCATRSKRLFRITYRTLRGDFVLGRARRSFV